MGNVQDTLGVLVVFNMYKGVVLRNALGVLGNVLGVLRNTLHVLRNVFGVLGNVL